MKIAMMTNSYSPFVAGVPISIERLSESLVRRGHEVVVFAPIYDTMEDAIGNQATAKRAFGFLHLPTSKASAKQMEEREARLCEYAQAIGNQATAKQNHPHTGVSVVRYRALLKNVAGGFSVPYVLDPVIEKEFAAGDFDLIHVHHPMLIGDVARYLARKYEVPLVFTYHTRYEQYLHYVGLPALKGLMPAYIRHCTNRCDMICAPSPLMQQYLQQIGVKPEIWVLPTGLPASAYEPEQEKVRAIRQQLKGERDCFFVTTARLAKEKNLEFLLRSMKLYREMGGSFRLVILGEGPYRKQLEKQREELGLAEDVLLAGQLPNQEIRNYCCAADLFLFPSRSETQGIVLAESMAVGTPVLAVRATGTEDMVIDGVNGYMTEASETAFAEKLMDILVKKEVWILSQGALRSAREYSMERMAVRAEAIYKEAARQFCNRMEAKYRKQFMGSGIAGIL